MAEDLAPPTTEKGYTVAKSSTLWWPEAAEEENPELRWPESVPIYRAMARQESQVISVLSAVKLPITSTGWYVEPNDAPPEVVAFIAENMGLPVRGAEVTKPKRARDRFSFKDHIDLALDMFIYGHAVFEQLYRIEADGRAWLRKLAERPQRTITEFHVARDGGLEAITQAPYDGGSAIKIPVDRLVVYSYQKRGGAWTGNSLLRPMYKYWLLKDRALRVQAQADDRNGLGIPVYTASPTPDGIVDPDEIKTRQDNEIEHGLKLASGMRSGESAGAAIPNGAKLTMQGVEGQLRDHDKTIRYYDEQIARAVLANFLSLGGENSRGSFALGETFADFFTQSLQGAATYLADVLTQHVVEDLVDINFGPDVRAPRITFDDIGSRHPVTAQAIYQLVSCGAILPEPALEEFLRTTYGLPAKTPKPAGTSTGTGGAATDTPTNSLRRTLAVLNTQLQALEASTTTPQEGE